MIIGIDPGVQGGIAAVDGREYWAHAMPKTTADIFDVLKLWTLNDVREVWIEDVSRSIQPGMGARSMFTMGFNAGALDAMACSLGWRIRYVLPRKWQSEFGLYKAGRKHTEKKNKHKAEAQRLFPKIKITHATADALLIAEFGRRQ